MKQYKFYLSLLTALVFLSLNAKPQEQVQVAYGESIENIILNVDKLLKDSLNSEIVFDKSFKDECQRWLSAKMTTDNPGGRVGITPSGEVTSPTGVAHMYSRFISNDGLHIDLILKGIGNKIKQIKSKNFAYHVGTDIDGLPEKYYAMAYQKDGISYFVYCFN